MEIKNVFSPEKSPAIGERTPLLLDTALLVKAPHVGRELTKDPVMLQMPRVNISWVASTDVPLAEI